MTEISLEQNLSYAATFLQEELSSEQNHFVECYMNIYASEWNEAIHVSYCADGEVPLLLAEVNMRYLQKCITNYVDIYSNENTDQALRGEKRDKRIINRATLARMTLEDVTLALILAPSNYILWNYRREMVSKRVLQLADDSILLLKELLFSSLILSCHYKLEEVWAYRKFVFNFLVPRYFSDKKLNALIEYDRHVVLKAAHSHPMNYNAWNYRRKILSMPAVCTNTKCTIIHREVDTVLKFLVANNSDRSAISFILFLLNTMDCLLAPLRLQQLWKELLFFTQQEIRRHCELGHECIWEFRLHLILFALEHEKRRSSFCCAWSIIDELNFISTYVNIYPYGKNLLVPSCIERGWYESWGNVLWTSFYACRYGIQLLNSIR